MVKRIYNIDKQISNEAGRNEILNLVIASSLTNQSVFSSKKISPVVGKQVAVEMIQ